MRGLETTPAIIIYSSIKMMIHIFPGWLDKAQQSRAQPRRQFYNKLFVASASSLQASRSSENEKRVGLTLAGVLCLHLAFTPYSHDDDDGSCRREIQTESALAAKIKAALFSLKEGP